MARGFTGNESTINQEKMATNFEYMLGRVNNMIKNNNIYSVWIRFVIGKTGTKIVLDSSSITQDENTILSLDYEKSGAGTANKFVFKCAVDLFRYGQYSKGIVEKFDELLYKAMNLAGVSDSDTAEDILYCRFQYGYNVTGDTQIVSPQYEGIITSIKPNIDYTNGKTIYTIEGTSFVKDTGIGYHYDAVEGNGLEIVAKTLHYFYGSDVALNTLNSLLSTAQDNLGNDHSADWYAGTVDKFNIDVPDSLLKSASTVEIPQMSDITPIDYCKYVLEQTRNTSDPKYVAEEKDYKLKDGEPTPRYILYITDSAGNSTATIHVAYIGSSGDPSSLAGINVINFSFDWFNRSNNIVMKWSPEVNLLPYFLARGERERNEGRARKLIESSQQQIEDAKKEMQDALNVVIKETTFIGPRTVEDGERSKNAVQQAKIILENAQATIASQQLYIQENEDKILEAQNENIEYYKSKLTLVGIPSDIPLNIVLRIKPVILEAVSRTQGMYYVTGSRDNISTNGVFTTTIDLFRYMNY